MSRRNLILKGTPKETMCSWVPNAAKKKKKRHHIHHPRSRPHGETGRLPRTIQTHTHTDTFVTWFSVQWPSDFLETEKNGQFCTPEGKGSGVRGRIQQKKKEEKKFKACKFGMTFVDVLSSRVKAFRDGRGCHETLMHWNGKLNTGTRPF